MRWFSPSPQPSVEGPTEHPACLAVPYNGNSFLTSLQANCQPRVYCMSNAPIEMMQV